MCFDDYQCELFSLLVHLLVQILLIFSSLQNIKVFCLLKTLGKLWEAHLSDATWFVWDFAISTMKKWGWVESIYISNLFAYGLCPWWILSTQYTKYDTLSCKSYFLMMYSDYIHLLYHNLKDTVSYFKFAINSDIWSIVHFNIHLFYWEYLIVSIFDDSQCKYNTPFKYNTHALLFCIILGIHFGFTA